MLSGKANRALLIVHECLYRYTILERIPDKTAASVALKLVAFIKALPHRCAVPSHSTMAASPPVIIASENSSPAGLMRQSSQALAEGR